MQANATINPVNLSRTIILGTSPEIFGACNGRTSSTTTGGWNEAQFTCILTNSTQVQIQKSASSGVGTTGKIAVQVVEFLPIAVEEGAGNTAPTFNATYPFINSTLGTNLTSENLTVYFIGSDVENLTTLAWNVTWFTNNITNFTTTLKTNHFSGIINSSYLDYRNLTAGQTWLAMVNLWDGEFITRANTTELLILSAVTDTCTYTSGTWNVNWFDNCTITSNINLLGNQLILDGRNGCGTFLLLGGNISNANVSRYSHSNQNQICNVARRGGSLN